MSHKWQFLFFIPLLGINEPIKSPLNIRSLQLANPQLIEQFFLSDINNKSCSQELESLTDSLLKDLPNYSNRIIQRTQNMSQDLGISTYILAAGKGEFAALDLPQIQYNSSTIESTRQVFFTTLERQYITDNQNSESPKTRKIERETYHWLFLTSTDQGWHMVTMYSRFGSSGQHNLLTPAQESSKGIIGQAIQLWLKDCRAGRKIPTQ
ncbi:MAG: hypothetical protein AB4372_17315 [Xenococcus sp. (in: cyanobacteria)]